MLQEQTGVYGAKVQSWKRSSPRDLLKELIDKNPKADRLKLLRVFKDKLLAAEDDLLDSVIEYWFANNVRSLMEHQPRREAPPARPAVEKVKEEIKGRATRMVMLDLLLPSGKQLKDATGAECRKTGGWLSRVAAKIGPKQKVGSVLSEDQLRALFRSA